MKVKLDSFGGLSPRTAVRLLQQNQAQVASDCDLLSGSLKPWFSPLQIMTPSKTGVIQSIYLYAALYWFHWTEVIDVVRSPIAGDVSERVIYTGVATGPKITNNTIAIQGGGTSYPNAAYDLGIPAPATAPAATGSANVDPALNESRIYVETYVSAWGEESAPSPVSAIVIADPNVAVSLSALNTVPIGNYNVISKRIYRSVDSGAGASFFLVAEIPVAQTTFNDAVGGVTVAANGSLLTASWDMPPANLTGIIELPNGVIAGFSGNELCFSVPYQPHAWPVAYRYATNWPIVGIGAFGNSVVVTTTGLPYMAIVSDPASVLVEKLETEQSCVAKRGIVDMGYAVAYPSPDGIMLIGMGVNKLITEGLLTRAEWQAYNPPSIHAYLHDGRYIAFYDATAIGGTTGCLIFDPSNGNATLTESTIYATGGYKNREDDSLYLIVGGQIVKWNGAATKLNYVWRSKVFTAPRPTSVAAGQVLAAAYPVTFKLFTDGVLKHTQTVADGNPFRLPAGSMAVDHEIELSGSTEIYKCFIAESISELARV